jgi:hypothetical protein
LHPLKILGSSYVHRVGSFPYTNCKFHQGKDVSSLLFNVKFGLSPQNYHPSAELNKILQKIIEAAGDGQDFVRKDVFRRPKHGCRVVNKDVKVRLSPPWRPFTSS